MDNSKETGVEEETYEVPEKKFSFKINRKLLPVKLQYLIFLGALGCALPYRTVFVKQLGFSGAAVGAIFTITPFVKIVTNPLIGAIVDYTKSFRLTNIVVLILVAVFHLLLVFVPPLTPEANSYSLQANIKLACKHRRTKIRILDSSMNIEVPSETNVSCSFQCFLCKDNYNRRCRQVCNHYQQSVDFQTVTIGKFNNNSETILIAGKNVNFSISSARIGKIVNHRSPLLCFCDVLFNCTADSCYESAVGNLSENFWSQHEFTSFQFWSLFALIAVSSAAFSANLFLMDAACCEILDGQLDKYGHQRVWGAAGFGIGSLIGGYVNYLEIEGNSAADYTYCFYALAIMSIVNILPVAYIKVEAVKYSQNILEDVGRLLCNIYFLIYILLLLVAGILSGLIWNYLAWFLEEIGGSPIVLGLAMATECFLSELPCFLIAGWVIKKIGHMHCLSLTFLCFGVRYIGFVYLKDPWQSLALSLLHGPSFGIFFASVTSFGKENAPPGVEATMQAILSLSFEGIGVAIGTFLGGVGFQAIGSRATFWYAGIIAFFFFLLSLTLGISLRKVEEQGKTAEEDTLKEAELEIGKNEETQTQN